MDLAQTIKRTILYHKRWENNKKIEICGLKVNCFPSALFSREVKTHRLLGWTKLTNSQRGNNNLDFRLSRDHVVYLKNRS